MMLLFLVLFFIVAEKLYKNKKLIGNFKVILMCNNPFVNNKKEFLHEIKK